MSEINSSWFAGPKAENAEWFSRVLERIAWDYYFWRRNYFPKDGAVLNSRSQRENEAFRDGFEDQLTELLGRLKGDCPFYSPRYAGHMLAEQTLPSIAGYFATMLYNPNNVSSESSPVTLELELEVSQMIAGMLGHDSHGWAHLCSGGTAANIEALWVARSVLVLPELVQDVRAQLGLTEAPRPLSPQAALAAYADLYASGVAEPKVRKAVFDSPANLANRGVAAVFSHYTINPILIVPETHHYCFGKAIDLLGLGRSSLRRVRVDADFRMDTEDLSRTLEAADRAGEHVLAVVAVMGTTEEGAIDPLDQIVAVRNQRLAAGKPAFWIHADGAYGGYLRSMMIPERIGLGQPMAPARVRGEERELALQLPENQACNAFAVLGECDSITLDPHKLGYIPYPAGAISFKDARIKPLVKQVAPYLQDRGDSFAEEVASDQVGMFSLEGSKPGAAAAAVWLSHRCIPLDTSGHGVLMRETIRNACKLHALLELDLGVYTQAVPLCPPGSNIVCYAFRPKAGAPLATINSLNRTLYDRLSISGEEHKNVYAQKFFVSRTTLEPGQYDAATVASFLARLGVSEAEYEANGVFLLRSVLMNPWYTASLEKDHDVLAELAEHLFELADALA